MRLSIVNPVGTNGRLPTHMGWSERVRDRETETERQRRRQKDGQTVRQTEKEREKQTDKEKQRESTHLEHCPARLDQLARGNDPPLHGCVRG